MSVLLITIDGTEHRLDTSTIDARVTPWDVWQLETELAGAGVDLLWDDLPTLFGEVQANPRHPDRLLTQFWLVWLVYRLKGDPITLAQAGAKTVTDVTQVADPQDRKPPNPRKARPGGQGSGRAAAKRAPRPVTAKPSATP